MTMYFQQRTSWCGPATAQNVMSSLGLDVPRQCDLASLMAECGEGVTVGVFKRSMNNLGVRTRRIADIPEAWIDAIYRGEVLAMMIYSRFLNEPHWVSVDGYERSDDSVRVVDPCWFPVWKKLSAVRECLCEPRVLSLRT